MPLKPEDALKLCKRRHAEWVEFQKQWRRLQDSLEGGVRYQQANYYYDPTDKRPSTTKWPAYGFDTTTGQPYQVSYGQIVDRNLIPHLSEMSSGGWDVYTMRLERTPVPRMVERIVNQHLSKIYRQEIRRTGGKELTDWWENVDGTGTDVDKWLRKTIAPLFLVCGNLDIVIDLPALPTDRTVESRADELELGLNQPLASFILPENLFWWQLDLIGRYTECLVLERTCDTAQKNPYTNTYETEAEGDDLCFRHYTPEEITLYDGDGDVVETRVNPFGFVPIVRLFDVKKHRCKNTGQSRYEGIADLQRAFYNTRSEIILNDVFQSHPILSGPEDFIQEGGKVKVGPDGILPKKKLADGNYEGWEFVDPPQSCAAELCKHCEDYVDEADRLAAILKPAGHTTGKTVAQSGVSKQMDNVDANDLLSEIAETMADAERALALMIESVVARTRLNELEDTTEIVYPRDFKLDSADELTRILTDLQGLATAAGDLPEMTEEVFKKVYASLMTGIDDERLKELVKELQEFLAMKAQQAEENAEAREVLALTGTDKPLVQETLNIQGQADSAAGPVSVKPFDNSAPPNSNRSSLPSK